jgi:prepilin-type processing-associated H-X9-DG protein
MSSETVAYGRGNSNYSIKPKRRRFPILTILVAVGGVFLLASIMLSSRCGSRELANRVQCASNMKQIGLAAIMWANDHGGKFPDDLDTLLAHEDLPSVMFNCPSSSATPAQGPTTQAVLDDFHQTGHLSYIYIGKGLTTQSPADAVVLYELPDNHKDDDMSITSELSSEKKAIGMNVLFSDGHTEWMTGAEAEALRKKIAAGVFPVLLSESAEAVSK